MKSIPRADYELKGGQKMTDNKMDVPVDDKEVYIRATGLTPNQINIVKIIVKNYRRKNAKYRPE